MTSKMSDRELLEAAAKAVGMNVLVVPWPENKDGWFWCEHGSKGAGLHRTGYMPSHWNPLTDDGDALRLAVRLNIPVIPYDDETSTGTFGVVAKNWGSKEANTRRAIVRAAAAMAVG